MDDPLFGRSALTSLLQGTISFANGMIPNRLPLRPRLTRLSAQGEWRRPEFARLKGKYTKLGELRFDVRKVEYRPIGFFGPNRSEFTILIGSTKKGRVYDPHCAFDTALSRRSDVLTGAPMFGKCDFRKKLWSKLRHKEYRNAYVSEHVRRWIAHQIRALREHPDRKWKQGELSDRMGKPQSVVSRLEDPTYGKMTVQTLLEVAAAFDVALIIKFVSFPRFVNESADLTQSAMQVDSFNNIDQIALHSMHQISFPPIKANDKIIETGGGPRDWQDIWSRAKPGHSLLWEEFKSPHNIHNVQGPIAH